MIPFASLIWSPTGHIKKLKSWLSARAWNLKPSCCWCDIACISGIWYLDTSWIISISKSFIPNQAMTSTWTSIYRTSKYLQQYTSIPNPTGNKLASHPACNWPHGNPWPCLSCSWLHPRRMAPFDWSEIHWRAVTCQGFTLAHQKEGRKGLNEA